MMNVVSRWQDMIDAKPIEEFIAEQYDPTEFRVTKRSYPKEAQHVGAMISAPCFVLSGKCRFDFDGVQYNLEAGDYCVLPEGRYRLDVLGDSDCSVVLALKLPVARS